MIDVSFDRYTRAAAAGGLSRGLILPKYHTNSLGMQSARTGEGLHHKYIAKYFIREFLYFSENDTNVQMRCESIIVPDFIMSVHGSSCTVFIVFSASFTLLFFLYVFLISCISFCLLGTPFNKKRQQRSKNEVGKEIIT